MNFVSVSLKAGHMLSYIAFRTIYALYALCNSAFEFHNGSMEFNSWDWGSARTNCLQGSIWRIVQQQEVAGFDVAVQDPVGVALCNCPQDRSHVTSNLSSQKMHVRSASASNV